MYDITNRESFIVLEDIVDTIEGLCGSTIALVLVGNKSDLEEDRQVSIEEGKQFAEEFGMEFFETSAQENINLDEVIDVTFKKCYDDFKLSQ